MYFEYKGLYLKSVREADTFIVNCQLSIVNLNKV